MDELDIRIIRSMGIRPYAARAKNPDALKPAHIAKQVGSTVNTVKSRIARMEASGVIAGYRLMPNLRHFGLTGAAYYFASPPDDRKGPAIEGIMELGGGLELHDFLGGGFCVDFTYTDEAALDKALVELRRITDEDEPIKFYDRDMPPVGRALTSLDWRILRALRSNATRSLDDVGAELRVTGRTVRTRYARMASEGSFFSVPMLDPSKAEGLFLFEILLYIEDGKFESASQEILTNLNDSHVYAYVPSSPELGHLDVLLFARSTGQVEELREQAAAIAGVERAEAWLFRGLHDHSTWMDAAIDARIAALTP